MVILVSLWLFAFGVLALAGYWRLTRILAALARQLAAVAERATRAEDLLARIGATVERPQTNAPTQLADVRTKLADARAQIPEDTDGPLSMRRPLVTPPHAATTGHTAQHVPPRDDADKPTPAYGHPLTALFGDRTVEVPALTAEDIPS